MKTLTPTALRKNIFSVVKNVLHGDEVLVHTREGDVLMQKISSVHHNANLAKKIPGEIRKPLGGQADTELRKYAVWSGE